MLYVSSFESVDEEMVAFIKAVVNVELQPSVVTGSFVALGLGWPKPIHKDIDRPAAKPVKAP